MLEDRWQLDAISDLRRVASEMRPPGLALEETFHPFVAFVILPLFAFFNAGVPVTGLVAGLTHPVGLGVIAGLVAGKFVGITVFSWLAVTLGGAERPREVTWSQLAGSACLGGIGFTMSMFVTQLAFSDPQNLARAKVGILAASLVAGAVIVYSFWLMLATLAFWFVRVENMLQIFSSMYEAGRWPVGFYPRWLRFMLTFLIPVAFATTVPAQALAGRLSWPTFAGAFALAAALAVLSRVFWRVGVRRYSGASS